MMEFAEDTLAGGQNRGFEKYIPMGWKLKGGVLMAMVRPQGKLGKFTLPSWAAVVRKNDSLNLERKSVC